MKARRTATVMVAMVVAAVLCGCDRGEAAAPQPPLPTAPLALATPTKATTDPQAPDTAGDAEANEGNGETACEPAVAVSPRALSAAWPRMIGKRVSFVGRIRRSLGFGEALVSGDGARFDVMLSPADVWIGAARRTYRVIGSSSIHLGGPTRLPQLLLESGGCAEE